jgi:hypothetical protein
VLLYVFYSDDDVQPCTTLRKVQDAVTVKIFSSICKVSDCVDYNVALIEDLDKNRMPMPNTSGKFAGFPVGTAS